jgi:chromosome segregation ATPase
MMKQIFSILLLLFIISVVPSFAEIYKWIDQEGIVHYTDDIMQIPEKDRPMVEEMRLPQEEGEKKIEGDSSLEKKVETYKDRLGRGEEYWRNRIEEGRKRLKVLQEKVEDLRSKYNELTEKYNQSRSSIERATIRRDRDDIKSEIDQNKIQIEEVKNMLGKKIPEEAELYRAKPEWIK